MRIKTVYECNLDALFLFYIDCGKQTIYKEYDCQYYFFVTRVVQNSLNTFNPSQLCLQNNRGCTCSVVKINNPNSQLLLNERLMIEPQKRLTIYII
jgi:hypothetical protein